MKLIVIFGAAVRPDGTASPTLRRRVLYAVCAAHSSPDATIFCSGSRGRYGESEASVMASLLTHRQIDGRRIVLDEASHDTLTSVVAAAKFARSKGASEVIVITDSYHFPRVRMLFSALGQIVRRGPMARGRVDTNIDYWFRMHARELLAIAYDFAVMARRRNDLRRDVASSAR